MDNSQLPLIFKVIRTLDTLEIPYFLGGSYASGVHGEYRQTADADVIADVPLDKARALSEALQDEFYSDVETIRDAIRRRSCFNFIHLKSAFKIDIFLPRWRSFEREQMSRRELYTFNEGTEPVYIASAEDAIIAKLEWYRDGGEVSDRQWRDILGMLSAGADHLDYPYLATMADDLGVADLLRTALKETEPLRG